MLISIHNSHSIATLRGGAVTDKCILYHIRVGSELLVLAATAISGPWSAGRADTGPALFLCPGATKKSSKRKTAKSGDP